MATDCARALRSTSRSPSAGMVKRRSSRPSPRDRHRSRGRSGCPAPRAGSRLDCGSAAPRRAPARRSLSLRGRSSARPRALRCRARWRRRPPRAPDSSARGFVPWILVMLRVLQSAEDGQSKSRAAARARGTRRGLRGSCSGKDRVRVQDASTLVRSGADGPGARARNLRRLAELARAAGTAVRLAHSPTQRPAGRAARAASPGRLRYSAADRSANAHPGAHAKEVGFLRGPRSSLLVHYPSAGDFKLVASR